MSKEPTKGYLVVASKSPLFYKLAINLIRSIKDFDPEGKVCFFTEEIFCDGREAIADYVFFCENHVREKLSALSKTPFDITMYIDADCEVQHEDVVTAFDMLDGNDLMFTPLTEERMGYFKKGEWDNGRLELNGGVFVYDIRKLIVKDFVKDWNLYYRMQRSGEWWPDMKDGQQDFSKHPEHLCQWDQFTLWWLLNHNPKYKDIKLKIFEDEIRWNWYTTFRSEENYTNKEIVIYHYSDIAMKKHR